MSACWCGASPAAIGADADLQGLVDAGRTAVGSRSSVVTVRAKKNAPVVYRPGRKVVPVLSPGGPRLTGSSEQRANRHEAGSDLSGLIAAGRRAPRAPHPSGDSAFRRTGTFCHRHKVAVYCVQ
jgi:hypothetical protein